VDRRFLLAFHQKRGMSSHSISHLRKQKTGVRGKSRPKPFGIVRNSWRKTKQV
jgi:hypothetical protein